VDDRRYPGVLSAPFMNRRSTDPEEFLECFLTLKTCTACTNGSTRN
jgi:hypothetical protein